MLWAGWDAVIRWWDGVELWLTGLVLPLQVAILMLVLLPVCWWAARVIDRVFGMVFERIGHRYPADAASSEAQTSSEAQILEEPR
ncbi:MAG: hypothetical protein M3228_12420 [Actinomycetota bacterium]|nr:hypothetical protein [Actinomycetota bacterium]